MKFGQGKSRKGKSTKLMAKNQRHICLYAQNSSNYMITNTETHARLYAKRETLEHRAVNGNPPSNPSFRISRKS